MQRKKVFNVHLDLPGQELGWSPTPPMSGQPYTYAVTDRMGLGKEKDFKTFKGCGTFVN